MASNKVARVCEVCGTEFEILESRVRRGDGKYCSVACCTKARTTGKLSRTPEGRRAERERAKERNPNFLEDQNRKQREIWRKRNPHKPRPDYPVTAVLYKGPLVSRKEAVKAGEKRYFTGQTCKFGHIDQWYVTGGCVHCRRIHASRKEKWESLDTLKGDIRPRTSICEICQTKTEKVALDHCHETMIFRGWLCERCNLALGMVNDDPKILKRMIRYLERHGKTDVKSEECSTGLSLCWASPEFPDQ